jgi:hypothetical protein
MDTVGAGVADCAEGAGNGGTGNRGTGNRGALDGKGVAGLKEGVDSAVCVVGSPSPLPKRASRRALAAAAISALAMDRDGASSVVPSVALSISTKGGSSDTALGPRRAAASGDGRALRCRVAAAPTPPPRGRGSAKWSRSSASRLKDRLPNSFTLMARALVVSDVAGVVLHLRECHSSRCAAALRRFAEIYRALLLVCNSAASCLKSHGEKRSFNVCSAVMCLVRVGGSSCSDW